MRIDIDAVCKTATALANGDGGDILIGVDANKNISGIVGYENIIEELAAKLHSEISPSVPFSITPFSIKGKEVILLSLWSGANKPYSYKSKIYVRRTNNTVLAISAKNEGVNEGVNRIKIEGVNEGIRKELFKIIEFVEINPG